MKTWLPLLAGIFCTLPSFSQMQLSFEKTDPTCFNYTNGIAIVNPSGGVEPYTYQWQNGLAWNQWWGISAGTYSVTVTDATGSTAAGSVTLNHPDLLTVNIDGVDVACEGFNGTLTAKPSGGTFPYTYKWSDGQESQVASNITSGDWMVTVLDSKLCHDVGTRFVDIPSQIFPGLVPTHPICFDDNDGMIVANTYGNHPPFSYQWSSGSISNSANELAPGTYQVSITDDNGCTLVFEQTLTSNPQLLTDVQPVPVSCFGQTDGSVAAVVSGGVPPYISFNWEKNGEGIGNQPVFQNVGPGNYSVTVVDNTGCTIVASNTVTEPSKVAVNLNITPTQTGGTVHFTPTGGTPPYQYLIDGQPVFSNTIDLPFKSNYYLTVKDSKGCETIVPFEILNSTTTNCLTVFLITSSTNCDQQATGTANAIVTAGGTGSYSYQWAAPAPNQNVAMQTGLAGGIYSVTITDLNNGCTGVATGEVKIHATIVLDLTSTPATCPNSTDGSATVNAFNGVQPYEYFWSNGGTTASILNIPPGNYQVTVVDNVGCSAVGGVAVGTVSQLKAAFTHTFDNCTGSTVDLLFEDNSTVAAQITGWAWTFASGTSLVNFSGQIPPAQTLDKDQTITVQLTVSDANGCTDLVSTPIAIPGGPDFSLVDSLANCEKVVISPVDTASLIYSWSPTAGLDLTDPANPIATLSGIYTATATNSIGCTATKTVVVEISPALNLSAVEIPVDPCDDLSSITATATGATSFSWEVNGVTQTSAGSTLEVDSLTGPTTIIVTATNAHCTEKDTVKVVSTPLGAAIIGDNDLCVGEAGNLSVTTTGNQTGLTYEWTPAGLGTGSSINVPTNAPIDQIFTVIVTNPATGCSETVSDTVKINEGESLDSSIYMYRCNGLEVIFWIDPPVAGTWNFGDGTTSTLDSVHHFFPTQGNYDISFTPAVECYDTFEYKLTVLDQQVLTAGFEFTFSDSCLTDVELFLKDKSTPFNSINSWDWKFAGLTPGSSTSPNPATITVNQNGSYLITLTVQSAVGCRDTISQLIEIDDLFNPPNIADAIICPGEPVVLNPNGNQSLTYDWCDPIEDIFNPTASPDTTTVYCVHVSKGDCFWDGDVTVTVKAEAALTAPADVVVCDDDLITLTATSTNATGFDWKTDGASVPGGSDGSIDINPQPGVTTYIVTALGDNLICPNTDTVIVTNGLIQVAADPFDGQLHPCTGNSATFGVINLDPNNQTLNFEWDPSGMTGPYQTAQPGNDATYKVTVTNQHGCADTLTFDIDVINLQPEISVTGTNDTICPGEQIPLQVTMSGTSGPYTYAWSPATGLSATDVANPVSTTTETVEYTVIVTDKYGCSAVGKWRIQFIDPTCSLPYVFIPNAFSPFDGDNVNNQFCVRGNYIRQLELVIYDRWGEKVFETTTVGDCWDGTFKGEELTADAYGYYVRVICDDNQEYIKKGNVTLLR